MAEPFCFVDMAQLLENKYVLILGDSVQRSIYKDMICALQETTYLTDKQLRSKGDKTFANDKLLMGGKLGEMTNGTQYREVRQYQSDNHLFRFYFLTRCHSKYLEQVLCEVAGFTVPPDVVILNSCLWDISRYGGTSVTTYKKNLGKLVTRLKEVLPPECLVIWNTTLPISSDAKGGFIVPEIEAMTSTLRLDITHANHYANQVMAEAGFDVLDLHFFMRHHIHRRAGDGVHWDMTAHRRITNLLLTHISEAWSRELPTNSSSCKLADTAKLIETHQAKNAEGFDKHVISVSEAVKARPKVKARRRNQVTCGLSNNFPPNRITQWFPVEKPKSTPNPHRQRKRSALRPVDPSWLNEMWMYANVNPCPARYMAGYGYNMAYVQSWHY